MLPSPMRTDSHIIMAKQVNPVYALTHDALIFLTALLREAHTLILANLTPVTKVSITAHDPIQIMILLVFSARVGWP